jgi:BASS family bile acid:Na+ symporter
MLSDIAKTDPAYTAAHILAAALGTTIIMPIGVPLAAPDLHAGAGVIARPLLVLDIAPFGVGIIVRWFSMKWADRFDPMLRKLVAVSNVVLLTVALLQNWDLSFGLSRDKRGVVAMGAATRNVGAAPAPLCCPASPPDVTDHQINLSKLVRHKPILKPVLEPFCLC